MANIRKEKIAVLTTVFPGCEKFADDFFSSINSQTVTEFDVVVVNDGFDGIHRIIKRWPSLRIIDVPCQLSPSKNKEFGIRYAKHHGYDFIVFCDIDDYFDVNRVEKSCILLRSGHDIACNELTLVSDGIVHETTPISNRIENNSIVHLDFIRDKNIFGFTNTAINLNSIEDIPEFASDLIASDWFFFTELLNRGLLAVFTNETNSYYRQHEKNSIGLSEIDQESYDLGIEIKLNHYRRFDHLSREMNQILHLRKSIDSADHVKFLKANRIDNPLWHEEVRPYS